MENLAYFVEVLRFIAVPAAVFELVPKKRRHMVEEWLFNSLTRVLKHLGVLVVGFYIAALALIFLGPIAVLLWLAFGSKVVNCALYLAEEGKSFRASTVFSVCHMVVLLLASILVATKPQWAIAVAYPIECLSRWLTAHPFLDYTFPDFSAQAFFDRNQLMFESIRDWLWGWLAKVWIGYFYFAKGCWLLLILVIEFALAAVIVLGCFLVPAFLAYLFIRFSDFIKSKVGVEGSGRIPVGAAVLLAVGETLGFVLETIKFFS